MPPNSSATIYLMGIGGVAMGTLAVMLKEEGYRVTGSDQQLYPPMSTYLQERNIQPLINYDKANIERTKPDLIIVGNVITRDNPEAQFMLQHELPHISMSQAIERYFLDRHKSIVVAGTHGKSTTTGLLGWVLEHAHLDPSVFVGAIVNNWQRSHRLGRGPFMVLEGDEYDTAFFDKGPKFLHYRPHIAIVTSIEFDHADIFTDLDHVYRAFDSFAEIIDPAGCLIVNADDPLCRSLVGTCPARCLTYGRSDQADCRLLGIDFKAGSGVYGVQTPWHGEVSITSNLIGRHNAMNALGALTAASVAGIPLDRFQEALLSFAGMRRRQEILIDADGIVVIDDFAHHPTAVRETVKGIRDFYQGRRIVAVFEPRTNSSRRNIFQQEYGRAFEDAHWVAIKPPANMNHRVPEGECLNTRQLARDIGRNGTEATLFESADVLLDHLLSQRQRGDVVLFMSNGGFDHLPWRFADALTRELAWKY